MPRPGRLPDRPAGADPATRPAAAADGLDPATGALDALDRVKARVSQKDREARQAREQKAQAETEKDEAQRRARRDRIGRWLGILVGAGFGIFLFVQSQDTAADVAELSATGQVGTARATSAAELRGDPRDRCEPDQAVVRPDGTRLQTLLCATNALTAAGVAPIPDPGPKANAYQLSIVISRNLGRLDSLGELRRRGVALPGVKLPDASGRFPARPDR